MASGTTRLGFASTRASSAWREAIWVIQHLLAMGSANSGYTMVPDTGSISCNAVLSSCYVAETNPRIAPTLDEPGRWLETGEVDFMSGTEKYAKYDAAE